MHVLALFLAELLYRPIKASIGNEVVGSRNCGFEAALNLVLTLRARVKEREPILDAVFDTLVITSLKMQAVVLSEGSPVTAVQSRFIFEVERARNRCGSFVCENKH